MTHSTTRAAQPPDVRQFLALLFSYECRYSSVLKAFLSCWYNITFMWEFVCFFEAKSRQLPVPLMFCCYVCSRLFVWHLHRFLFGFHPRTKEPRCFPHLLVKTGFKDSRPDQRVKSWFRCSSALLFKSRTACVQQVLCLDGQLACCIRPNVMMCSGGSQTQTRRVERIKQRLTFTGGKPGEQNQTNEPRQN